MPDKPGQQAAKPEPQTDTPISLNIRLIPRDHADQPVMANYSAVNVAQGVAYLDFGFIEPALLAAVARAAQENKPLPKEVQGRLASRVALPLDALVRLHQQLQQMLVGLQRQRAPQQTQSKGQA